MHISLEMFNNLFGGSISQDDREALMDHVLDCDSCASRFKMLNALAEEMAEITPAAQPAPAPAAKKIPMRYVLGVAAIMVMSVTPYLTRQVNPMLPAGQTLAQAETAAADHQEQIFSILEEVRELNLQANLSSWNQGADMRDLVGNLD